ncbi:hypothetical protein [Candidatus Mycoplasma haematominutum]|uniref:Uncharacterized protein n=1 Tax=Candidatus Mycoplasma haematominutum 'Birmingham 1' TaxID=1116213 RepID=G8C3R3_9MOLU|nr:hypothetical protein [Candidatus Mycoplasma haematominutum]CCE66961.1 hypothetical protein MHM_04430 [Candidatus Mycoplasma haematominutum 'Birmingham 1']
MFFLLKWCLGIALIAGLSSAVAVPVVVNSRQAVGPTTSRDVNHTQSVSVNMCGDTETASNALEFGTGSLGGVCWNAGDTIQASSDGQNISKALQSAWGSASFAALGLEGMTDYCDSSGTEDSKEEDEDGDNQGYLTLWKGTGSSCNGTEYLRLGNSSNTFLKKKKEASNAQWKTWLCVGDCWEGTGFNSGSSTTQASVKEKQNSWSELKYYKQTEGLSV